MGTYSHKLFICPFYKSDRRKGDTFSISCDGCIIRLQGRKAFNEYADQNCCSHEGWQQCTVAMALKKYYESA